MPNDTTDFRLGISRPFHEAYWNKHDNMWLILQRFHAIHTFRGSEHISEEAPMSYWRFAAMIATSTVVMFVLMYLNTYALEHLFWSETRVYMAILMGATMAVIMLC